MNPFPRLWQRADEGSTWLTFFAPWNGIRITPQSTMLPAVPIQLEHHRLGRIC